MNDRNAPDPGVLIGDELEQAAIEVETLARRTQDKHTKAMIGLAVQAVRSRIPCTETKPLLLDGTTENVACKLRGPHIRHQADLAGFDLAWGVESKDAPDQIEGGDPSDG